MTGEMSDTISRNDPCFCGSGKKYKKCHSDINPKSRAALLLKLNRAIDDRIKGYQESTGYVPPCHSGCANCCFEDFSITEIEFELIMRELKSWDGKDVERVYNLALDQCEKMKKERPYDWRNLEKNIGGTDTGAFKKQLEAHRLVQRNKFPCPLLDTDTNSCKVYDSRPIVCRSFGTAHTSTDESSSFEVCEHIPDSRQHAKITPNVEDLQESAWKFTNIETPSGQFVFQRAYPIYYWFRIFYNRTGEKKAQYNYYDRPINFNQTLDQANRIISKEFNLI